MAPPPKVPLTVVIPTLNEAWQIAEAMDALRWVDEVIVADGGSSDETVAIARERGATVLDVPGRTIAGQRNAAIAAARNEWVLALDADERVSDALREELAAVLAAPSPRRVAYRIRCQNIYLGRERRRGKWGRDWHVGCSGAPSASSKTACTSGSSRCPTPARCAARSATSRTATSRTNSRR